MTPLQDPTYLKSPIESILSSLEPNSPHSIHALIDAYGTFSNRIRAQAQELQQSSSSLPALQFLHLNAPAFSQALRRDVSLAHIDPFASTSLTFTPGESLLSVPRESTADVVKHAGNMSALCQQALCALSAICRFPALCSLFSGSDISSLLAEILKITLSPQLPILNSAKTFSLSLWILRSQRLPQSSLSPRATDIISVLRRVLRIQPVGQQLPGTAEDGLKCICHLLEHYSTTFSNYAIQLLPSVLSYLLCNSSAVRFQAALALGKITQSLLDDSNCINTDHRQATSDSVLDFFDKQCTKATLSKSSELHHIVQAALSAEEESEPGDGPVWLLSTFASLIILSDYYLFSHPKAFKFIIRLAGSALAHRRSVVRALIPHLWSCITFVFARIPDEDIRTKESVILFFSQDLGGGIGLALVTTLLNTSKPHTPSSVEQVMSFDTVFRALKLVHDMAHTSNKYTSSDSLLLLHRLTSGVGAPPHAPALESAGSPMKLPIPLFDGSITTASWDRLKSVLRSIHRPPIAGLRNLSETEIIRHRTLLHSTWVRLARSRISGDGCLPPELIHIWQSLLLVESQLTQEFHHLTTSTDLVGESALIITGFIPRTSKNSEELGPVLAATQVRALTAITQLWFVMKNVFASLCIFTAARVILTNLLKHDFLLTDEIVRERWNKLCADLMVAVIPSCSREFRALTSSQATENIARELWSLVAQSLLSQSKMPCWLDIVDLLAVPLGSWRLSDVESAVWNSLLQMTLTSASQASTVSSAVIDAIAQAVPPLPDVDRTIFLRLPLLPLLSCFIPDASCPPDSLLSIVNTVLCGTYKPDAELTNDSLQLLEKIREIIVVSSPSNVFHILESLQTGLQRWIEDKAEILAVDAFNSVVMTFYSDTLAVLERYPPSLDSLHSIEFFLSAGFSRIVPPALGPLAFERFWKATYHGRFSSGFPVGITSLLSALAVYGGDLLVGVSLESQSTTSSDCTSSPAREANLIGITEVVMDHSFVVLDEAPGVEHLSGTLTPRNVHPSPAHTASTILLPDSEFELRDSQDDPCEIHTRDACDNDIIPSGEHPSPSRSSKATPRIQSSTKRNRSSQDLAPQKRPRTIQTTHKPHPSRFISEPSSRVTSQIRTSRSSSVPVVQSKRMEFDGVVLPTLRQVVAAEQSRSLGLMIASPHRKTAEAFQFNDPLRSVCVSSSLSDDSDDYDSWEIRCPDMSTSEMELDDSLGEVPESSLIGSSILQEVMEPAEMGQPQVEQRSKSQESYRVTQHCTPLRRSNSGSLHLDALRDVYVAVTSGASQIPVQELLQATKLVHQIGAVLTEQMGKKLGDSS